jgi:hypothetical protein
MRDTDRVLAEARQVLDFSQPVAVMLLAVLPFITDEQDPAGLIRAVPDPLAPGSYLALGHHRGHLPRAGGVLPAPEPAQPGVPVP